MRFASEIRLRRVKCLRAWEGFISFDIAKWNGAIFHNLRKPNYFTSAVSDISLISSSATGNSRKLRAFCTMKVEKYTKLCYNNFNKSEFVGDDAYIVPKVQQSICRILTGGCRHPPLRFDKSRFVEQVGARTFWSLCIIRCLRHI